MKLVVRFGLIDELCSSRVSESELPRVGSLGFRGLTRGPATRGEDARDPKGGEEGPSVPKSHGARALAC
jgi:hypothetical protein